MSPHFPVVDVNLFVHDGADTVAHAIESVLAQTWPALTLTLIDNGSTDRTVEILDRYAERDTRIRMLRNRVNTGAVLNCQRAFWNGNADFVMPKTADDLLAPDFLARVMPVLLEHPECAMCHAGGLVFVGPGDVRGLYPSTHRLSATGTDPIARAAHVMTRYTSAPSFWGVYRRRAVNQLRRFSYRPGWDHAVLAELALHGEIRSIDAPLYWRRDGGKPVSVLARGCSEFAQRGLQVEDELSDHAWRMPLIATAYGHVETFAVARTDAASRRRLMRDAVRIFRQRWLPLLQREAAAFRALLPALIEPARGQDWLDSAWKTRAVTDAIEVIRTILPEQDFAAETDQVTIPNHAAGGPPAPVITCGCDEDDKALAR